MSTITSKQMQELSIDIYEPFSEFLMGEQDEFRFQLSLLDVVRFAGHACPSMVGAFLISKQAVNELFPDTRCCVRGEVAIELGSSPNQGATGPISNVFSFIFGAWEQSGFGGLQGRFQRRNLLKYNSADVPPKAYRFRHLPTGKAIDVFYDPQKIQTDIDASLPFQKQWRLKITDIVKHHNKVVWSEPVR